MSEPRVVASVSCSQCGYTVIANHNQKVMLQWKLVTQERWYQDKDGKFHCPGCKKKKP